MSMSRVGVPSEHPQQAVVRLADGLHFRFHPVHERSHGVIVWPYWPVVPTEGLSWSG